MLKVTGEKPSLWLYFSRNYMVTTLIFGSENFWGRFPSIHKFLHVIAHASKVIPE
jgi:hypothetical protein